eukprot:m.226096 g.226096  ORF g.226096 m.226096 type:complete len:75 (+) comp18789_c0_seq10:1527-1751(+)
MPEVEFGANTLHMPNRGWKEDKTSCSSEQHSLHTSPSSQQNGLNIVALVHHLQLEPGHDLSTQHLYGFFKGQQP